MVGINSEKFHIKILLLCVVYRIVICATTVTIDSFPAGTPVSGYTNTFDYPILSDVVLTCMVDPIPTTPISYQWNTTGCYNNSNYNGGNQLCFPIGQRTQTVVGNGLTANDAGNISCIVAINGSSYNSEPFTLRVSGIAIITGNNDLSFDNLLDDYSLIFASGPGLVARCITGLGPNGDDNTDLGGWFFSGLPVFNRECSGLVIQQDGALMRGQVGVVDLYQCLTLSTSAEGIYTCMIMNSSMMIQTMRVGLYFDGRSAPMIVDSISSSPSNIRMRIGFPLVLSCTSKGSPPDTFTWSKDSNGLFSEELVTIRSITHTSTSAVFEAEYLIRKLTLNDSGVYICNVTNPIGSNSRAITVNVYVPLPEMFITILGEQMVGQKLVLQCVATAVEGITVGVNIVWRKDGSEFLRVDQPDRRPALNGSVQYTDVQEVAALTPDDHDSIYQCEMVIYTTPPVVASKELQVDITVPPPIVDIAILTTPRVGEQLVLECSVTTVKDIVFRVDIEWRNNFHTVISKVEGVDVVSSDEDSERHLDNYIVPQLSVNEMANVYRCTAVVNTDPPVRVTSSVTVSTHDGKEDDSTGGIIGGSIVGGMLLLLLGSGGIIIYACRDKILEHCKNGRSSNIQTGNSTMQPEFTQPNEAPPGYKASQECQARSLLSNQDPS